MANLIQSVALEGARFFAHHGYYPEEQKIGNVFYLDIVTRFAATGKNDDEISDTINYETLYEIAQSEMSQPKKLLETVVCNILNSIKSRFEFVQYIEVTLQKVAPPFAGEVKNSVVSLAYSNDEL